MGTSNPYVIVVIPTYKRDTVFKLLDSLQHQSYKNFDIMIIYKPWEGYKKVLDKIKEYKTLSIRLIKQNSGFFEEALNLAYRKADSDIVIHTDDDAWVDKNWITEHVEIHKKNKKIGMVTGRVIENIDQNGKKLPLSIRIPNELKWLMNKHTLIDKPITKKFIGYGMYLGKSGMLVDTGKRYELIKTLKQHGVNMSWKLEALTGFKLPGFTLNGGGFEACAALEAIERGFIPVWFSKAVVFHPVHQSLSRSSTISKVPVVLTAERVLFAYYAKVIKSYKVDLNTLKLRNKIDRLISKFISKSAYMGYKIGYEIATKAIEENWKPAKVRYELATAVSNYVSV